GFPGCPRGQPNTSSPGKKYSIYPPHWSKQFRYKPGLLLAVRIHFPRFLSGEYPTLAWPVLSRGTFRSSILPQLPFFVHSPGMTIAGIRASIRFLPKHFSGSGFVDDEILRKR